MKQNRTGPSRLFAVAAPLVVLLLAAGVVGALAQSGSSHRVLVFSKTLGYRHASITNGITAIRELGAKHEFDVDAALLGNSNCFLDRLQAAVGFIAQVREVGCVVALEHMPECDHLCWRRIGPRWCKQARGQAERASLQRVL